MLHGRLLPSATGCLTLEVRLRIRSSMVTSFTAAAVRPVRCVHFGIYSPIHKKFCRSKRTASGATGFGFCGGNDFPRSLFVLTCLFLLMQGTFCITFTVNDDDYNMLERRKSPTRKLFTNQWAVRLDGFANEDADRLAAKYGFINNGRVLADYYLFTRPSLRKRSVRSARHFRFELSADPQVHRQKTQLGNRIASI